MTYPPGNPGYQPGQPPGPYGGLNPAFAKSADHTSQLPRLLQIAVVALGLATYLVSFGPMMTVPSGGTAGPIGRISLIVPLAVLAALLAAVGLLPKAKNYTPVVAVLTTMAVLLAVARVVNHSAGVSVGWALWLVLALTALQAVAAVGALLLDAGVVTAPAPRPMYPPYPQYGMPPSGGYYGQPGQPTGYPGRGAYQAPQQSGYASYGGYSTGPATGGFGASAKPSADGFSTGSQSADPQGPPTPPTGFPSFGSAQSGGSPASGGQGHGSADAGQGQQPHGEHGSQTSSSDPSGPTPS